MNQEASQTSSTTCIEYVTSLPCASALEMGHHVPRILKKRVTRGVSVENEADP